MNVSLSSLTPPTHPLSGLCVWLEVNFTYYPSHPKAVGLWLSLWRVGGLGYGDCLTLTTLLFPGLPYPAVPADLRACPVLLLRGGCLLPA